MDFCPRGLFAGIRPFLFIFAIPFLLFPARALPEGGLLVQAAERPVTLTGYTRSRKTMTLACEVAGKVLGVHYDMGETIGKAPFLTVDTTFIDLQIQGTRQTLHRLQISRKSALSRIGFLEKESQRILSVFQKGGTTEQRKDAALQELEQARLNLQSIVAEIAAANVRLEEQRERRRRHFLFAPAGWIVTGKHIEEGELVTAGTPVALLSDFRQLVVPLSVSRQSLSALENLPREFEVHVEGRPAKAVLNWVNPRFDEKTRKVQIELLIPRFEGKKRGGLVCRMRLKIPAAGVQVPKAAVSNRYENPRVFLLKNGDAVPVFILEDSGDFFRIAEDPRLPPGTALMSPKTRQEKASAGDAPPSP